MTVERHSNLESEKAEWVELAKASHNVFATWEWNETWWRHFRLRQIAATAEGREPLLLTGPFF